MCARARVCRAACVAAGAYPTGLGFRGFPKSCCTSVNEVVCHGIPDSRPLEEGDVVTIDCVAFHNGFHGDNARTVVVRAGRRMHACQGPAA
jgi:methionyl aminopeptidase